MKVFTPSPDDYERMAQIYNCAILPFWDVYTTDEKTAFAGQMTETVEGIAFSAATRTFLCVLNDMGAIAGYAAFRKKNEDVVWISSLYVDPVFQRGGFGGGLLRAVEDSAHEMACPVVALETHARAVWAIGFYMRYGYTPINDRLAEYPFSRVLEGRLPVSGRPVLAKKL